MVEEVGQNFSVARLVEGKDVRVGDRAKVDIKRVCFEGSEEGFFLASSVLPKVERGKTASMW